MIFGRILSDINAMVAFAEMLHCRLSELFSPSIYKTEFVNGEIFAYRYCLIISDLYRCPQNAQFVDNAPKYYIEKADSIQTALSRTINGIINKLFYLAQNPVEEKYFLGMRTAYVECLEVLQHWEKAPDYGLDFDIEKIYPLI